MFLLQALLEFSAVFDSVDHDILLRPLLSLFTLGFQITFPIDSTLSYIIVLFRFLWAYSAGPCPFYSLPQASALGHFL